MTDNTEFVQPFDPDIKIETQRSEEEKVDLYKNILYRDATSLLGRYLPEALPQEPTAMFIGDSSVYIGKFKDTHYICIERDVELNPMIQALKRLTENMKLSEERGKLLDELERKRIKLISAKADKGEYDFDDIDKEIDQEVALIWERSKSESNIEQRLRDSEDPDKLQEGASQYQTESWMSIYAMVHELIHQRQAELYPSAFPQLSSPELDSIDYETTDRAQLHDLLIESHKSYGKTQDDKSLFYPVVEGMAALGSFYIMGKFIDELAEAGEKDAAEKLREVRNRQIRNEIIDSKRSARAGKDDNYVINYPEGLNIMRKLYKKFGLRNIPEILASVDLNACRQITKDSSEYQRMIEDPTYLPGLRKAGM